MPRTTDSRQQTVRTAARLLRRQGYAATGWRQVVAESQAPWGSQSHYFPGGKEQLAVEAITMAGRSLERLLRSALDGMHPADAVELWTSLAASELRASGWVDGCPVATVALETAATSEALAAACSGALASWHAALEEAISARGAEPGDATALATLVLAAVEGALLLARARRDPEPLDLVGRELSSILRTRLA